MKKTLIIGAIALSFAGIVGAASSAKPSLTPMQITFPKMVDVLGADYILSSIEREDNGFEAKATIKKNGFKTKLMLDQSGKLLPESQPVCLRAMSASEVLKGLLSQGYTSFVSIKTSDDDKCLYKVVATNSKNGEKAKLTIAALTGNILN